MSYVFVDFDSINENDWNMAEKASTAILKTILKVAKLLLQALNTIYK